MLERRAASLECRAAPGHPRRLEGYAAIFNSAATIGDFAETIAPGAFRASLAGGRDILALVDHNPSLVLGRSKSGSLRLSEDARGLAFALDLPDTQAARDVLALAERGDLGGMSFGFDVPAGGDEWRGDKRTLRAVNLHEISVVQSWPAYPETIIVARARPAQRFPRRERARLYLQTLRG
jgi:HK97 family phage prohead protease